MTCINYIRCVYAWMGKHLLFLIAADFSRLGALQAVIGYIVKVVVSKK